MTWLWEELTARDFPAAVAEAQQTCLLPIGVLEKHGEHLPLGTDVLNVRAVALRAVQQEPAIVFPWYCWGQIHEAKQWPGAIALRHELLFAVLENTCEEIARNGLAKIALLNGHGGNNAFLDAFVMFLLERRRPYTVYLIRLSDYAGPVTNSAEWKAQQQSASDHHAGEVETSLSLAVRPDLVKMQDAAPGALPQKRLGKVGKMTKTAMFWYADYPDHYAGDAACATPAKGEFLLSREAQRLADILKAIKDDTAAPALEAEYNARIQH